MNYLLTTEVISTLGVDFSPTFAFPPAASTGTWSSVITYTGWTLSLIELFGLCLDTISKV